MKILVTDPLAEEGLNILRKEGFEVSAVGKLSPEELKGTICGYEGLIVRSGTKVTKEVIEKSDQLKVIGRAGVGLDNVDIESATRKGIVVMNSPAGNTISTAEHTFGLLLSLARNIPQANSSLKNKEWEKKKFTGTELYGKTLGIIGLGRVGSRVSLLATSFGMKVFAYDPYISEEKAKREKADLVELEEILKKSDFITLHIPLTSETKGMIGEREFALMKDGAYIINCARGGLIDEKALYQALISKKLKGAAFDVYEKEPPFDSPVFSLPNVITTPHLGASTSEAQRNVAVDICHQITDYLKRGVVQSAANLPSLDENLISILGPYLKLAERLGSFQGQIYKGRLQEIRIKYSGELSKYETTPIRNSLLKGILEKSIGEEVNYINVSSIVDERGIKILETRSSSTEEFTNLIVCTLKSDKEEREVYGTLFGKKDIRIVKVDDYLVEAVLEGNLLVCSFEDRPGVIGKIGTLLGEEKINIAGMSWGRKTKGGTAITLLNLDSPVPSSLLSEIRKLPFVKEAKTVRL